MEALRRLSFQEKMAGQVGSMSAMVRAAIDTYLKSIPPRPDPFGKRTAVRANVASPERANDASNGTIQPFPDLLRSTIGRGNLYLGSRQGSRHFPATGLRRKMH